MCNMSQAYHTGKKVRLKHKIIFFFRNNLEITMEKSSYKLALLLALVAASACLGKTYNTLFIIFLLCVGIHVLTNFINLFLLKK